MDYLNGWTDHFIAHIHDLAFSMLTISIARDNTTGVSQFRTRIGCHKRCRCTFDSILTDYRPGNSAWNTFFFGNISHHIFSETSGLLFYLEPAPIPFSHQIDHNLIDLIDLKILSDILRFLVQCFWQRLSPMQQLRLIKAVQPDISTKPHLQITLTWLSKSHYLGI